jgi:competence protein ComEC
MFKIIFLLLVLHPSLCANKSWFSFVVFWNVGQGQWITAVTPDQCLHYDFGGELSTWAKNKNLLFKLCKSKQNVLHLSHPDLDHYAYYSMLVKSLAKICWGEIDHTRLPLKRVSRKIPACENEMSKVSQRLYVPMTFKTKNDSSKIYAYKSILIPGDSSQKQEKIWVNNLNLENFKILALGHHGSKTSTSEVLLKKLRSLKMAVVQSRKKKFNHPHKETVDKLNKYYVPLIKTEDWGNTAIVL